MISRTTKINPVFTLFSPSRNTIIAFLSFLAWVVSSWITHVVVCINASNWLFLLVGAFVVPVGVIHGTGVWFGFF